MQTKNINNQNKVNKKIVPGERLATAVLAGILLWPLEVARGILEPPVPPTSTPSRAAIGSYSWPW